MLRKPLTIVAVLLASDYLLWLWSNAESHDTTALVAGLLLVLLAVSLVWLLIKEAARALTGGRLGPRRARSATSTAHEGRRRARRPARRRVRHASGVKAQSGTGPRPDDHAPPAAGGTSSPKRRRIAA